jgi:uncharacterized protein Smg (DUF494 family)
MKINRGKRNVSQSLAGRIYKAKRQSEMSARRSGFLLFVINQTNQSFNT